ncbi:MAG: tRNA lysidine(34) synthetase TilS [Caldiserica bacterium]|jgi:tRNA(Ile)-lysidine synthase|nr:tRNA lysidine(34) synthetase TilS [Caldisericota bacterium]MDH7562676.1 tRNA lysidine(34) synthetase TilS [Caldisericota bacterium]
MRDIKAFGRKFEQTLRKIPPLKPGHRILVGVSGGADSCALLFSLLESQWGFQVVVAHFDHQIREGSEKDREFVQDLCHNLNIPFFWEKGNVLERKERDGLSLEEACRFERMDFLFKLKRNLNLDWIALGHTLDDQVETILLRLFKGSGPEGLKGIPLFDENRGLIHPLLCHSHEETVNFCQKKGIAFREDPTNFQPINPRNILRNILIPEIEKHFPQAKKGIFKAGQIMEEENRFISGEALKAFKSVWDFKGGREALSLKLKGFPLAIQRRVIQLFLQEKFSQATFQEVEDIRELFGKQVGKRLIIGDFEILRGYGSLIFQKVRETEATDVQKTFSPPAIITLPDGRKVCLERVGREKIDFKKGHSFFDPRGKKGFLLRFWKPGDTFRPLGLGFEKKLQDFFVDRKVPREMRKRIPLIEIEGEIACLVGLEVSDCFKISEETEEAIHAYILEEDKDAGISGEGSY